MSIHPRPRPRKCAKARSTVPETEAWYVDKLTAETRKVETTNLEGPDSKR